MLSSLKTAALLTVLVSSSFACAGSEHNTAESTKITREQLVGEWSVVSIQGDPVSEQGVVYLGFADDGQLHGNATVNQIMGSWTLDGSQLMLDRLGSTRMAGPPQQMAQERRFMAALELVAAVQADSAGQVTIVARDGSSILALSPRP